MTGKPAKLKIEYLSVSSLLPYARNSRTHSEAQIAQIAASIREFGFTNPVLISPENDIIAGHGRVRAAALVGADVVPCIRLGHLTETQRRAYVIADNRLAENSGWDLSMLAVELEELNEAGFEMDLLGFEEMELQRFLNGDDEPAPPKPRKESSGATEFSQEQFQKFDHQCPRCGFEFDGKRS